MNRCRACGAASVGVLLDFGPQPPSNRFVRADGDPDDRHPLVLGQCAACGLVQLVDPMAPEMVRSRYDWLTYREPEGHLDALVERLAVLPGIEASSAIHGLTYKDDSTLARFERLGYGRTASHDAAADFGVRQANAGLETIQQAVSPEAAPGVHARHGRPDLLLVRHVVEHAHDPLRFLQGLRALAAGAYIVLEMPDCTKFIDACDYAFVWEEHVCYFSGRTFRTLARAAGLSVVDESLYPYPFEDSLIVVLREGPDSEPGQGHGTAAPERELAAGARFRDGLAHFRRCARERLDEVAASGRRVAVFGAGHLAAKFVNLAGLADRIAFVIDDHPKKQGLRMPGSGLPIVPSSVLADGSIGLCLLAVSPESEQAIRAKHGAYLAAGGRFASIFRSSPGALVPEAAS